MAEPEELAGISVSIRGDLSAFEAQLNEMKKTYKDFDVPVNISFTPSQESAGNIVGALEKSLGKQKIRIPVEAFNLDNLAKDVKKAIGTLEIPVKGYWDGWLSGKEPTLTVGVKTDPNQVANQAEAAVRKQGTTQTRSTASTGTSGTTQSSAADDTQKQRATAKDKAAAAGRAAENVSAGAQLQTHRASGRDAAGRFVSVSRATTPDPRTGRKVTNLPEGDARGANKFVMAPHGQSQNIEKAAFEAFQVAQAQRADETKHLISEFRKLNPTIRNGKVYFPQSMGKQGKELSKHINDLVSEMGIDVPTIMSGGKGKEGRGPFESKAIALGKRGGSTVTPAQRKAFIADWEKRTAALKQAPDQNFFEMMEQQGGLDWFANELEGIRNNPKGMTPGAHDYLKERLAQGYAYGNAKYGKQFKKVLGGTKKSAREAIDRGDPAFLLASLLQAEGGITRFSQTIGPATKEKPASEAEEKKTINPVKPITAAQASQATRSRRRAVNRQAANDEEAARTRGYTPPASGKKSFRAPGVKVAPGPQPKKVPEEFGAVARRENVDFARQPVQRSESVNAILDLVEESKFNKHLAKRGAEPIDTFRNDIEPRFSNKAAYYAMRERAEMAGQQTLEGGRSSLFRSPDAPPIGAGYQVPNDKFLIYRGAGPNRRFHYRDRKATGSGDGVYGPGMYSSLFPEMASGYGNTIQTGLINKNEVLDLRNPLSKFAPDSPHRPMWEDAVSALRAQPQITPMWGGQSDASITADSLQNLLNGGENDESAPAAVSAVFGMGSGKTVQDVIRKYGYRHIRASWGGKGWPHRRTNAAESDQFLTFDPDDIKEAPRSSLKLKRGYGQSYLPERLPQKFGAEVGPGDEYKLVGTDQFDSLLKHFGVTQPEPTPGEGYPPVYAMDRGAHQQMDSWFKAHLPDESIGYLGGQNYFDQQTGRALSHIQEFTPDTFATATRGMVRPDDLTRERAIRSYAQRGMTFAGFAHSHPGTENPFGLSPQDKKALAYQSVGQELPVGIADYPSLEHGFVATEGLADAISKDPELLDLDRRMPADAFPRWQRGEKVPEFEQYQSRAKKLAETYGTQALSHVAAARTAGYSYDDDDEYDAAIQDVGPLPTTFGAPQFRNRESRYDLMRRLGGGQDPRMPYLRGMQAFQGVAALPQQAMAPEHHEGRIPMAMRGGGVVYWTPQQQARFLQEAHDPESQASYTPLTQSKLPERFGAKVPKSTLYNIDPQVMRDATQRATVAAAVKREMGGYFLGKERSQRGHKIVDVMDALYDDSPAVSTPDRLQFHEGFAAFAQKTAADRGMKVVGDIHAHTGQGAVPSDIDLSSRRNVDPNHLSAILDAAAGTAHFSQGPHSEQLQLGTDVNFDTLPQQAGAGGQYYYDPRTKRYHDMQSKAMVSNAVGQAGTAGGGGIISVRVINFSELIGLMTKSGSAFTVGGGGGGKTKTKAGAGGKSVDYPMPEGYTVDTLRKTVEQMEAAGQQVPPELLGALEQAAGGKEKRSTQAGNPTGRILFSRVQAFDAQEAERAAQVAASSPEQQELKRLASESGIAQKEAQQRTTSRSFPLTIAEGLQSFLGRGKVKNLLAEADEHQALGEKNAKEAETLSATLESNAESQAAAYHTTTDALGELIPKEKERLKGLQATSKAEFGKAESLRAEATKPSVLASVVGGSLVGTILGSTVFGAAFGAVNAALEEVAKAAKPVIDRMTDFRGVVKEVDTTLSDAVRSVNGQLGVAVAGQLAPLGFSQELNAMLHPILEEQGAIAARNSVSEDQNKILQSAVGRILNPQLGITESTGGGIFGIGNTKSFAEIQENLVRTLQTTGPKGIPNPRAGGSSTVSLTGELTGEQREANKIVMAELRDTFKAVGITIREGTAKELAVQREAFGGANAPGLGNALAGAGQLLIGANGQQLTAPQAAAALRRAATTPPKLSVEEALRLQAPQIAAERAGITMQGNFQRSELQPAQFALANAASPLPEFGAGFLGSKGGKDLYGSAFGKFRGEVKGLDSDLAKMQTTGEKALDAIVQRADIAAGAGGAMVDAFHQVFGALQTVGQRIVNIQTGITQEQTNLQVAQLNNQLRIARRSETEILQILGMQGRTQGDNLGLLEREQIALSRKSQELGLQSQLLQQQAEAIQLAQEQRGINFQVALAGFTAPGITGEERAARIENARREADFAQRLLDIKKEQFGIEKQQTGIAQEAVPLGFEIEDTKLREQLTDVQAEIGLLGQGIKVTIDTAAAEQVVNRLIKKRDRLADQAASFVEQGARVTGSIISATSQLVAATGGAFSDLIVDVSHAWGIFGTAYENMINSILDRTYTPSVPGSPGSDTSTGGGRLPGDVNDYHTPVPPPSGHNAAGFYGTVSGATQMTVGEAGPETVAIIRNPRTMTMAPSGGGGINLTVNVSGNTIGGNKNDQEEFVRLITRRVEETLSRKTSLLGIR